MHTELMDVVLPVPMPKTPRTPGVHVSSIIRAIAIDNGYLKSERMSDKLDLEEFSLVEMDNEKWWNSLTQITQLRICFGLAWEEFYIPYIGGIVDHPGELELDGIFLSPDGESMDSILTAKGEPCKELHEVKATYKSTKTVGDLGTQFMWLAQTKAYCKAMGTLIAYVHVLFLCGDYKYPISPQLKVWRVEYTQGEIDANWEDMVGYVEYQRNLQEKKR